MRNNNNTESGSKCVNTVIESSAGGGRGTVQFHVCGSGRPLVLLHSLLADRASFDRILAPLADHFTIYTVDLPGFGASDAAPGNLDIVADRVAAATRGLGLTQKPVFLGNGYGAFVALLVAIRHGTVAERLVLAGCGAAFSKAGRAAFRTMSSIAAEKGLEAVADTAMRRLFSPEYQAQHMELTAACKVRFLATSPDTFHAACSALATLDLRAQLAAVSVPTLVMVGEMDEATPPVMARELASGLPDAQFVLLPGCAHVPQLQEPQQFLNAIASFIDLPRR